MLLPGHGVLLLTDPVSSTNLTFSSRAEHRAWLAGQAVLPAGFRVGTASLSFVPEEAPKPARMTLTLIALDRPTPDFAAVFTRNAVPGAPVVIGRKRLGERDLGAVIVNNKVSNVCAPDGEVAAERVSAGVAAALQLAPAQVLPGSTGVIGWRLPVEAMLAALPAAVASLDPASALPAALGIMTTDRYPKIRRAAVGDGAVVGIAKGAGMIEPHLATMLAFILTDLRVPRESLRAALARAADASFNLISVDGDTSTSDTVVALSSGLRACPDTEAFEAALTTVCRDLAEDVVRNGEGVHHVLRAAVGRCPDEATARAVGKAIVNSPLVKCAACGNDPNVGRIIAAIGKVLGAHHPGLDLGGLRLRVGGMTVFDRGAFRLSSATETSLVRHLKEAEMYAAAPPPDFPPHERCVELDVDLGLGPAAATVVGADLSHEYITENADYRS